MPPQFVNLYCICKLGFFQNACGELYGEIIAQIEDLRFYGFYTFTFFWLKTYIVGIIY